jgi:hypothetical protein
MIRFITGAASSSFGGLPGEIQEYEYVSEGLMLDLPDLTARMSAG